MAARRSTYKRSKSMKIRVNWDRVAATVLLAVLIGIMLNWAVEIASSGVATAPRCTDAIADAGGVCHGEPLPACPTEDSTDCYWDARTMGNGLGRSFIDVGGSRTFGND